MRRGEAARVLSWSVRDPRRRRIVYGTVAVVLALLCVFPPQYRARTKLLPDNNSAGELASVLGALGGRTQNFASLFGDRGTVEVALQIARSQAITDDVIRDLKLVGPGGRYSTMRQAQLALGKSVEVHSLTGAILEVQVRDRSPSRALRLTQAYLKSISARIADYGRDQIRHKRRIVESRRTDAAQRLSQAEAELNAFKKANQLADPQIQLGSQLALRTNLQGQLQAKLVELQTIRQSAGPENPTLRAVEAQVASLRSQLAQASRETTGPSGPSIVGLTSISLQYANLYRDYSFAQGIYDVYSRSAEEVAVQELVSQSSGEVAVIDTPHVDPQRYYNVGPLALLGLLALFAFFTEFYVPATGMFPRPKTVVAE